MKLSIKSKVKVLTQMLTLAALLGAQSAMAQSWYQATDGTEGANKSENYPNLFDDDATTKWCVVGEDLIYVEFQTENPIIPIGYTLTTANDTQDNPGRNPTSWTISAKSTEDSNWTTIATEEDNMTMGAENYKSYNFSINNNTTAYQYFRFEVSSLNDGDVFQLSEFSFIVEKNVKDLFQATIEGLQKDYYYTGTAINIGSFTVLDADKQTIAPSKYNYSIQDAQGNIVTDVIMPGKYRLVVTPSDDEYQHQKVFNFEVYPWSKGSNSGFCGNLGDNYGHNVYYTITTEDNVKTLYIKKNPGAPEGSAYRMKDYDESDMNESAIFAPWIEATAEYDLDEGNPEDPNDDSKNFLWYLFNCDIEKVVIGEGVTYIGLGAFYSCDCITSIIAPSTLEEIGGSSIYDTKWYNDLPDGIVYVGGLAYTIKNQVTDPTTVVFKDGTMTIGNNVFDGQENTISSVVIPASVKRISESAFYGCAGLKTVTIGAGVEYIGSYAFLGCSNVTDVYCYANPNVLTWEDGNEHFRKDEEKTKCHVLSEYLSAYKNTSVNVEFVGDLNSTLTVNAKEHNGMYWATHYNTTTGYKITNDKACAYTATFENNTLTLHKLGKVIPAATAVILVGEDAEINMAVENASAVEYTVSNDLKGVEVSTPLTSLGEGDFFVMGKQEDSFGFFKYNGTNMPAHKAYLQAEGTSNARGINMVFDDNATALTQVESEKRKVEGYYDLQGRKVTQPTKGVYIVNGKKIVIK